MPKLAGASGCVSGRNDVSRLSDYNLSMLLIDKMLAAYLTPFWEIWWFGLFAQDTLFRTNYLGRPNRGTYGGRGVPPAIAAFIIGVGLVIYAAAPVIIYSLLSSKGVFAFGISYFLLYMCFLGFIASRRKSIGVYLKRPSCTR